VQPLRAYVPPGPDEKAPLSPSFDAAVRARWDRGPITDHSVFGRRSGAPIAALHAHLTSDEAFAAFAAQLELMLSREPGHDETELWAAERTAAEAGVPGDVGAAIAFLIGQRTSSDATARPCAMALAVAALEAFGVPENAALTGLPVAADARRVATTHRDALVAFLHAQKRATSELLSNTSTVVLARSDRRDRPAPEPGVTTDLHLRPLSSWATTIDAARGMAKAEDATRTGHTHVYISVAEVPADRIISTWATGIGAQAECEVVLAGAAEGDQAHAMR
jgi:hypothetical protein